MFNKNGDIILLDNQGTEITIGSLKHGISYSRSGKARKVARVTIQPNDNNLTDEFFFTAGETDYELIFQHAMNRDTNPNLLMTYLLFFNDKKSYAPAEFIKYVIKQYFIKELGYQFPGKKAKSN